MASGSLFPTDYIRTYTHSLQLAACNTSPMFAWGISNIQYPVQNAGFSSPGCGCGAVGSESELGLGLLRVSRCSFEFAVCSFGQIANCSKLFKLQIEVSTPTFCAYILTNRIRMHISDLVCSSKKMIKVKYSTSLLTS